MRWKVKSGVVCAILACAGLVMADGTPRYKSAADQSQETTPQFLEGALGAYSTVTPAKPLGAAAGPRVAARVSYGETAETAGATAPLTPGLGIERSEDEMHFRMDFLPEVSPRLPTSGAHDDAGAEGTRGEYCGDPEAGSCCEPHGSPYCDDEECCNAVCSDDPYCCDVEWDEICAQEAAVSMYCDCGGGGFEVCGDPEAGDCCENNGTPGCADQWCCDSVCAYYPECCEGPWNAFCASIAMWIECEGCVMNEEPECPDDSLFSQRVNWFSDGWVGGTVSDAYWPSKSYERFWDVRGDICDLHWWGITADEDFWGCVEDPMTFEIIFYEDVGGMPGAEVCTYVYSVAPVPMGPDYGMMSPLYEYGVDLEPCCVMSEGFVSIVAISEPEDCYFNWISSPFGDGSRCYDTDEGVYCYEPGEPWGWDLSLCLTGTPYPGACCDDLTGWCEDEVEAADCPPGSRFEADMLCADLDPPCGDITGACCDGETCTVLTPSECQAAGGEYVGDYVPCDPNPCMGACCVGGGECQYTTESECVGLGGDYLGGGTSCDPNPCPPANDDCDDAEPIGDVTELLWDTTYATHDGDGQVPGLTIWYCYTAPCTGTVQVGGDQFPGPYFAPTALVFDGCGCDPQGEIVAWPEEGLSMSFDTQAGHEYLIGIGGWHEDEGGPGWLSIACDAWAYGACCWAEAPYCTEAYGPDCEGTFAGDGTTCDTTDCNGTGIPDACDIALGLSEDCNENGIPDECDIGAGTSDDYDLNGVPDECDPDCNENGITDGCDVDCNAGDCASHPLGCGGSLDCQPDGIPDECQLGGTGGDEVVLWDNGPPGYEDNYYTLVSQYGGAIPDVFIADDFFLPDDGQINAFHANFEDEPWFQWTGRVRIEVYPDNGEAEPDDSAGSLVTLWVPTDGGSVERTYMGEGLYADSYRYDVTDLDIELPAGIWWIGMASEGDSDVGLAAWASSRSGVNVVMGEAHLRCADWGFPSFVPASYMWWDSWDVSFSIGATIAGADCNENGIPDDCDIMYCDGSPWCLDCNENGIPDGCEPDCNDNDIADECDIRDCDGSPWCLDCNENGIPDGCEPDCNDNGIADECDIRDCDGSPWCQDCNENGIPDECDISAGTSDDYDLNGVPDECDPDCNENGITDGCDVDCSAGDCASHPLGCGGSLDCQPDGIPDECQMFGELEYLTDDGTQENSVGLSAGGYVAWMTQFTVAEGFERIDAISLAWGDVPDGTPTTVYLWSDPDGDGDPTDAQVLAFATTVVANAQTDIFTTVDIPDTYVGPAGTSFFAGAIIEHDGGDHPAPLDMDESQGRSWIAGDSDVPIDPNDLGGADLAPMPIDSYIPGNWLLRATGFFNNECNDNGIPDDCDIAADPSLDCDGNGIIDACEWEDCNDNGVLDVCDMLYCPPGEAWCDDCNENGVPDDCDIAAGAADCQPNGIPDECEEDCNANDIPDDCDMRDCDGSPWCDDCNEDDILDACQTGEASGETYQWDDGSSENSLGIGEEAEIAWIQRFDAQGDSATIAAIATSFGNSEYQGGSGVSAGDTVRVFVWIDPEAEGYPGAATLVAEAETTVDAGSIDTDVLQEVPVGPVTVSGSFFIGASVVSEMFPTPMDESEPLAHESWIALGFPDEGGFDPTDFYADNMDEIGFSCDWLLRAITPTHEAENDCNGNGVPDECDIWPICTGPDCSLDCNYNGVPDECEDVDITCGALDIKPGSCPNPFNRGSQGLVPIALAGEEGFDVATIDISSVRLSRADGIGDEVAPHEGPPGPHTVVDDVATPFEGEECDCHELTGDGIDDLLMHFNTDEVVTILELNDLPAGALVPLIISGNLIGGAPFVSPSDCIRLVPPGTSPGLLSVKSNVPGSWIDVSPLDETLDGGGFADFERSFPLSTVVTLTAEPRMGGRSFTGWLVNGVMYGGSPSSGMGATSDRARWNIIQVTILEEIETVEAVYGRSPIPTVDPDIYRRPPAISP